ncbi:hydrogenase maturation protease [Streptomyces sp. NPDC004232]|uniref:hydrogenase maturation protease n=1 Tax=Streptomyces sp. NPDC004232 TaxID=3154454 RepID=UPI001D4C61AA|nr:hydrogenase maturation protease [Streptomyces sp. tea 10]
MDAPADPPRIAVIGIGNEFRHDDGVGLAVLGVLAERTGKDLLPAGTALLVCDGEPARLISLWENARLAVVIDCARAEPARPGRVHRLKLDGDRLLRQSGATSSHRLGLGDAVELARLLDRLPDRLVVYAVEGADSSLGTGLSARVAARVGPLADRIADEIHRYARTTATRGDV